LKSTAGRYRDITKNDTIAHMPTKTPSLSDQLAALRERITNLEAERHALRSAWRPRPEVIAAMERAIDEAAARALAQIDAAISEAARPSAGAFRLPSPDSTVDALCLLLGSEIKPLLAARATCLPWRGEGHPDPAARLAAIERELSDAHQTLDDLRLELETINAAHR
jgi:hypothetical protein